MATKHPARSVIDTRHTSSVNNANGPTTGTCTDKVCSPTSSYQTLNIRLTDRRALRRRLHYIQEKTYYQHLSFNSKHSYFTGFRVLPLTCCRKHEGKSTIPHPRRCLQTSLSNTTAHKPATQLPLVADKNIITIHWLKEITYPVTERMNIVLRNHATHTSSTLITISPILFICHRRYHRRNLYSITIDLIPIHNRRSTTLS